MSATARFAGPLSFVAALFLATGSPALASGNDGPEIKPLAVDFTVAARTSLLPISSAPTPGPIAQAAQTRPIDLGLSRRETSGFGAPALRRSLYVSFGALQVLDAVSTRRALNAGAREANPAMAGVVKSNLGLVAVKAGSAVATTLFVEKLAKKHPKRAAILMTAINSAYAAIVAHNYRVARSR